MQSFTTQELEQATGFDRRTIAYYVQKGLLPRVGRRGRRTRYPKLVMERLLCIRRVRQAEDSGEIEPLSLGEIRAAFDHVSADMIARVAVGQTAVATAFLRRPPDTATELREHSEPYAFADDDGTPRTRPAMRTMTAEPAMPSAGAAADQDSETAANPAPASETEVGDALAELQTRARNREHKPGSLDRWTRVEISPDIALSVRGATDEDAPLLESVGEKLRRLIADREDRPQR